MPPLLGALPALLTGPQDPCDHTFYGSATFAFSWLYHFHNLLCETSWLDVFLSRQSLRFLRKTSLIATPTSFYLWGIHNVVLNKGPSALLLAEKGIILQFYGVCGLFGGHSSSTFIVFYSFGRFGCCYLSSRPNPSCCNFFCCHAQLRCRELIVIEIGFGYRPSWLPQLVFRPRLAWLLWSIWVTTDVVPATFQVATYFILVTNFLVATSVILPTKFVVAIEFVPQVILWLRLISFLLQVLWS